MSTRSGVQQFLPERRQALQNTEHHIEIRNKGMADYHREIPSDELVMFIKVYANVS